jgi:hypothetical protein
MAISECVADCGFPPPSLETHATTYRVIVSMSTTPVDNTPDEILETVKEVVALATGKSDDYSAGLEAASDLNSRWRESLSMPYFYGSAQISLYYLKKHQAWLLSPILRVSEAIQG